MKRKLLLALTMVGILLTASVTNRKANAQISIGRRGILGGGTTDTIAKFTPDGTTLGDSIITDDGTNVSIPSGSEYRFAGPTTTGRLFTDGSNVVTLTSTVALSSEIRLNTAIELDFEGNIQFRTTENATRFRWNHDINSAVDGRAMFINPTVSAMDGSDTQRIMHLSITNPNHTGASNVLNGIDIAAITGDAQASESGIFIGTGWDQAISFTESTQLISSDGDGMSITANDVDGNGFVFISAGAASGLTRGSLQVFLNQAEVHVGGTGVTVAATPLAGVGGTKLLLSAGTLNAMNGSDTVDIIRVLGSGSPNHTGSGNTLNGIRISAITGDAQATENAINISTGWDNIISTDHTNPIINIDAATAVFQIADGSSARYTMRNNGSPETHLFTNTANGIPIGAVMLEILATSIAMNGSDQEVALEVNIINANHTGVDNTLIGVHIGSITGDADAIEYAIYSADGYDVGIRSSSVLQANLVSSLDDGSIVYCSDCNPDSTCTGSGSGAFAFRIGGSWVCELN